MNAAFTPYAGYGQIVPVPVGDAIQAAPGTTASGSWPHILSPANPIFWLGALAAVSLGLIGVGANVRIGKAKAQGSVGEA